MTSMLEVLSIPFSLIIEGYVAAAKAGPFWSQMIILAVLLPAWFFLKSSLAIAEPEKRARRLNVLWDTTWSVLVLIGALQWLFFVPSSQDKWLLLLFGLPLMTVIAVPFYLLFIHGTFVLGLFIWARSKHPEMMPHAGRHARLVLWLALAAFAVFFITRWKVSGRLFL